MNILAIDPANSLGFCHTDGHSGVVNLSLALDKHPGQRLVRLERWLNATLNDHPTDLIAAEDASFGSINPSIQARHNELRGVICLVAAQHAVDVKLFQPASIKAFATGSGRAKKDQMIRAAKTMYRREFTDHNEADAFWIMKLAEQRDSWPKKKTKPRRHTTNPQQKLFK